MIRVTRWSPDTCDCVLEYEWDDAQNENERVHTFKGAIQLCNHHKTLAKPYDKVISENTRKNMVFAEAQKLFPELTPGDYNWSFDDQRKLKAGFLKVNMMQKKQLQDSCDSRLGKGKVEVI